MTAPGRVFITGGTGYIGRALIARLLERGHEVHALARPGSASRLPQGCTVVEGDALHGLGWAGKVAGAHTFVHLVGVAHPSPARAREFRTVDLASVEAAVPAAVVAGVRHFVYLSVAQPAPVMRAYIAARAEAEAIIRSSGLPATILRPWYVLGPGHRWPIFLLPLYSLLELLPSTRAGALRLGMVTIAEMVSALVHAVEDPADGHRVLDVPAIRRAHRALSPPAAPLPASSAR